MAIIEQVEQEEEEEDEKMEKLKKNKTITDQKQFFSGKSDFATSPKSEMKFQP